MKMRKQRYMGAVLVAVSWLILLLALTGQSLMDRDATAAVFTLPLGVYMIFSPECILQSSENTQPKGAYLWQEKE